MENLGWTALEYEEKNRSTDWFWALGIIIVAGSIASIIFANYFFAALLIISGVLLGFFAIKKPETVPYELNNKGLKIKSRLYPYEKIKAFYVQTENKPLLFIKSERFFMPIISIPIEYGHANSIRNVMLSKEVLEEKMAEHPYEKIMEYLGF
jgi:hypothetical protein